MFSHAQCIINCYRFSISMMAWNVNGNLGLKIHEQEFLQSFSHCDITILLETWLHPGQEDSLPVPKDFVLVAHSRPVDSRLSHQWGGVAVLFHKDLPLTVVQAVSAPDLIVMDLEFCYVIASYLPPKNSNWQSWSDTDPEQRLLEALAYCGTSENKMVVLMGDLNARTASNNSRFPRSQRKSMDDTSDTRGRHLVGWCTMYGLSILNGTTAERDSPGALTCYQERGTSVIDYIIVSTSHQSWIKDQDVVIERSQWSDHCMVSVTITSPPGFFSPSSTGTLRQQPHQGNPYFTIVHNCA
jgi:exonuclease III